MMSYTSKSVPNKIAKILSKRLEIENEKKEEFGS